MLRWIRIVAALAVLAGHASTAAAQDYPSRPIRLLIHTPPGSLDDILGRLVGQELGDRLGQSLVVDTRPGGATMIAVEQLRNSPADGTNSRSASTTVTHPRASTRPGWTM